MRGFFMRGAVMADLGHGRGWLNDAPAASIRRIDAQIGHPLQITEAGRAWAQQKKHWDTYQRNGWPIALHPDTPSVHQLGAAIDSDEAQRILPIMTAHGWVRTVYRNGVLVEPWHFEYDPARDKHRNQPSGGATKPTTPESEEDDMKLLYVTDSVDGNGVPGWALLNTRTGKLLTLRNTVDGAQDNANSWARVWGDAKTVTRQDMLNAVDGIQKTI